MRLVSVPEVEAQLARLADYFEKRADGDEVQWTVIATTTGVRMTAKGKDLARRALRRIKRPYEALRGVGVRLSSPVTAMTIVRGNMMRVDGAMRVAAKTQKQLQARHLEKMSGDDQRRMLVAAGFFGALRAFATDAREKLLKG